MKHMQIEELIVWTFRLGVATSAVLLITGLALSYLYAGSFGYVLIVAGIFALFSTPVVRVFLSMLSFAGQKNLLYAAITFIVLADIMFALFAVPMLLHLDVWKGLSACQPPYC